MGSIDPNFGNVSLNFLVVIVFACMLSDNRLMEVKTVAIKR